MNYTNYAQQNHISTRRKYSRSGRVCALLDQSASNWIFPTYRHPGPNASENTLHAAHMARCVPVQAVEVAEALLERIDRYVFGGES